MGWKMVDIDEKLNPFGVKSGKKIVLSGNKAIALGALVAGCRFYAGYPITPASEILYEMAWKLPELSGKFFQAEDEIASIGMINAASACGFKAMTTTSGPGLSLMQEEIGWAIINEMPIVIVNAMRMGPSTGQPTKPTSADISCMINGRHGDGGDNVIILSPSSVKECFDMGIAAFNLSERFRTPVLIALDGLLSHLSETVSLPKTVWVFDRVKERDEPPFRFDGKTARFIPIGNGKETISYSGLIHDEWGKRHSFDYETAKMLLGHLDIKLKNIIPSLYSDTRLPMPGQLKTDKYEAVLISYGITARAAQEAINKLQKKGHKVGHLSLKIIWPLHKSVFEEIRGVPIIVAEANAGQLVEFIDKYVPRHDIIQLNKYWGEPITATEIEEICEKISEKKDSRQCHVPAQTQGDQENEETPIIVQRQISELDCEITAPKKYSFCPGCGHQSFSSIFLKTIKNLGFNKKNTVIVAGIGCAGIVGTTFDCDILKTSHGRTLNYARAIKILRPDLNVIVISGDGDIAGIGGNHLIHTVANNWNIIIICLNNCNYGMTGGQPSCTTPAGAKMPIPYEGKPIDLKKLVLKGLGAKCFIKTSVFPENLKKAVSKAVTIKNGTVFIEVLSPCTTEFAKRNPEHYSNVDMKNKIHIWTEE